MKKLFVVALMVFFLAGCGAAAKQSEFLQHDTMYKSWGHMAFSWFGYKNPTPETLKQGQEEGWWGIPITGK